MIEKWVRRSTAPSQILAEGFAFAECLRWHDGRLYFSDLHAHQVISLDMKGNKRIECEVPGRPGGLGWLPNGQLLLVAITERRLYRLENARLRMHADLSTDIPYFLNDMSVDRRGNAYVGNIGFDYYGGGTPKPATLWLVRPGGEKICVADDMHSPNGSVITSDDTLIVGESSAGRLTAFDIKGDGLLANRRVWAVLPGGYPDGSGLDADGAVWSAMFGSKSVCQSREGEGAVRTVPFEHDTYACAIGGPDMKTVFVATAGSHDPDECRRRRDSRIEVFKIDWIAPHVPA